MRTVRGPDGTRYLLLKESSDASLVRDPATGEERYLPNAELDPVDGSAGALELAATAVEPAVRRVLTATPNDRALGLLLELDRRGPIAAADLVGSYDLCESDVLGLIGEFRAAGLVEEATVAGERGYALTETGRDGVRILRALREFEDRS